MITNKTELNGILDIMAAVSMYGQIKEKYKILVQKQH